MRGYDQVKDHHEASRFLSPISFYAAGMVYPPERTQNCLPLLEIRIAGTGMQRLHSRSHSLVVVLPDIGMMRSEPILQEA